MLTTDAYREAFHREATTLAHAAGDLRAAVPSCPGWRVATLVGHLTGQVYAPRIAQVRALPEDAQIEHYDDLGLPPEFKPWFEALQADEFSPGEPPEGLLPLFQRTATTLEQLLYALPPETPIRTWWPPQQTAGFLQRRMALETAIHRWDTQLAYRSPDPIEGELAVDGIDEALDIMLPARRGWATALRQANGERYHLHRTDGHGEWLAVFGPESIEVRREHTKGDVALRGSASDLLLWLWRRIPSDYLEVFGDTALLGRFFELAPPD